MERIARSLMGALVLTALAWLVSWLFFGASVNIAALAFNEQTARDLATRMVGFYRADAFIVITFLAGLVVLLYYDPINSELSPVQIP